MVDFDFYKAPVQPIDFSPLTQEGVLMGAGFANAGQAIGAGLIHRARLQESQRQYNADQAYRAALARATEIRARESARHNRAQEFRQGRNDLLQEQHRNVLEQQADQRIQQSAQQFERTQTRLEADSAQRQADARRKADEVALQRAARQAEVEAGKRLVGEMLERGDISDQEHALATMQLDSEDPVQVRQVAQSMVAKSKELDQRAIDEDLKKAGPKELINTLTEKRKALEEAGLKVDTEDFLEARAAAIAFQRSFSRGPALASEFKQLQAKMAGVGSGKAKGRESEPKVVLPSGRQVADAQGLSKGGTFESMTRAQQAALLGLGQEEAQHDPRWPSKEQVILSATLQKGEKLTPEESEAILERIPIEQQNLAIEYANQIATVNGWGPGGQAQAAPAAAGPVTIESLKARAIAEGWSKEQFFEEARKAGIK